MTLSALTDELAQAATKKKEFLAQIDRIIPWSEWIGMIQPHYYKGERGNKPYDLELMLRIYLVQNLYDLSDMATMTEVIDSRAFSEFCGVDSSNQVPDGDTIGRFRALLVEHGMQEKLFGQVVQLRLDSQKGNDCGFHHNSGTAVHQKSRAAAGSRGAPGKEGKHLALWLQGAYRSRQGNWACTSRRGNRRKCP